MKSMSIFLFLFCMTYSTNLYSIPKRYGVFLAKLKFFYEQAEKRKNQWQMPNYYSSGTATPHMPMATPNYLDHTTGLEYSPVSRVIIDRHLQMQYNARTGVVNDLKTGKEFQLKDIDEKSRLYRRAGHVSSC